MGDLNPESLIRERLYEPTANPLRDRIGLWINSPAAQKAKPRTATGQTEESSNALEDKDEQATASLLQQRFSAGMQACQRLPSSTREPLVAIYFNTVNHMIPIVDQGFLHAQASGLVSPILEKAMCLAAAKTSAAAPSLTLAPYGPLLSSRQFCSRIYKELVVAMDAELEPDRLTRIRVLALMSLHCEGYEGAEAASLHLCQAIHQAQTVGLHLGRPNQSSGDPLTKLFWCLWTLDKMHASIGGRPVLLADRDIGVVKPNVAQSPRGAFEVWLAISELLATVISFYRPTADPTSGWEEGFPAFEQIVGEDTQEDLDFATLGMVSTIIQDANSQLPGFLELYYHSVAILSCRYKPTDNVDGRLSSVRQGLSAVRIHSIVASECADSLPPLPIVPYSITLSMGVSYRQLRSSKLITHLDRAKASLQACCSLLENISPYWYSAEAMARLGQKALHQVQGQPTQSRTESRIDGVSEAGSDHVAPHEDYIPAKRPRSNSKLVSPPDMALDALPAPDLHMDGFADIDTLFGEFLDISLPTNFWDPIFMEEQEPQS